VVVQVVCGILALVFTSLGVAFLAVGFAGAGNDPEGFQIIGAASLAAGLVFAGIALVARSRLRAAARRRREGDRARATIVRAQLQPYTRIGVLLTYTLTVRFAPAGEVTRKLLVPPSLALKAGEEIEVVYDPEDPANFEPAESAESVPG
jgi:hypothetical protein